MLSWLLHNGSVELQMIEPVKKYQLVVSVTQAAILCLFNEANSLTCGEVREKTNTA